jgi:hypothetical protein
MEVYTIGLEELHFQSLSGIAVIFDILIALGVYERFWWLLQTTWLSCNFSLTVSRKEIVYDMRF